MKPNLTNEALTDLQRSITQGEWRQSKHFIYSEDDTKLAVIECWRAGNEVEAECKRNADAVAIVPELIAEVIKLRKVLSEFVTDIECAGAEDWPDIGITAEKARAVLAGK